MVLSVIIPPVCATVKLNTIAKICNYRGLQEGHHFIPMAMEVHGVPQRDMNHFIREFVHLFHAK